MSLMITEVQDALLSAGAPDDKARKAAEVLANYDDRLSGIGRRLSILTWQVGALALISVPSLWLLLRIAAKVGALE
jgi:hypothetical protein